MKRILLTLMIITGIACQVAAQSGSSSTPGTTGTFGGWDRIFLEWKRSVGFSPTIPLRLDMYEYNTKGQEVEHRVIPLDDQGNPAMGGGQLPISIDQLSTLFFNQEWDLTSIGPAGHPAPVQIRGIQGIRVELKVQNDTPVYGEIWYLPEDNRLIQTSLYFASDPPRQVRVEYRENRAYRTEVQSIVERIIGGDRTRILRFQY